ncbi:hypothetical protein U0070_012148, partial [Myodes glareolus]
LPSLHRKAASDLSAGDTSATVLTVADGPAGPPRNYSINSQHHTSPDFYWVSPFADLLKTLLDNRTCQNSSSGGAIPSLFICVIGNILNKFSSDIFDLEDNFEESVFSSHFLVTFTIQFDFPGRLRGEVIREPQAEKVDINHGSNEATMEKTAEGKVEKGDFLLWKAVGDKSHLEACSPSLIWVWLNPMESLILTLGLNSSHPPTKPCFKHKVVRNQVECHIYVMQPMLRGYWQQHCIVLVTSSALWTWINASSSWLNNNENS